MMEPLASAVDKVKGFAKSTQDLFVNGVTHHRRNLARRHPIEILKRLQREAFSDLMKLRDRQDKVERMLSFHKSSNGNPFQEASTHVRGEVDFLGALLMMDSVDQQKYDTFCRAGMRTGIDSRFTFETSIRQNDTLVAEFVASQKGQGYTGDVFGSSLSLAKVLYMANASDWFSAIAIPVGAQCRDVGTATGYSHQRRGLTDFLPCGPSLLHKHNGSAIGLTVSKSNVVASLAQFVSVSVGSRHSFSTFGQVACQLSSGTKLSLSGLHQVSKSFSQQMIPGALSLPFGILKWRKAPEMPNDTSAESIETNTEENPSAGSIALVLESQLDESTRIGGWVEMEKSNPRAMQWAISMSDTPEDELGWGLSLGGIVQGRAICDHLQAEAFVKFNLGKRFSLQPGFVYVRDGNTQIPAIMFRSSWSL
ncbi:uncharacterized protein LOC131161774 [Malania oleifera]|uniref:uncharacterized protein LOC131161774 n=1 Tax=Malania oleifera TaxID=397392 RepID=UPI0025ADDEEC|nr:uncharacterized protein LOC131161774 [Malania oleifera]